MQYKKIYNNIIERAKNRKTDEYTEKHHITPRCVGGDNNKDNIIRLTFREHFLCHRILCKIYPKNPKIFFAFSCMLNGAFTLNGRFNFLTSRHFEIVKKAMRPYSGSQNKGRIPWNKGMNSIEYKSYFKEDSLKPPSMLDKKWINNGSIQTKIDKNDILPEGYMYGRCDNKGDKNPMKNKEVVDKMIKSRYTRKNINV